VYNSGTELCFVKIFLNLASHVETLRNKVLGLQKVAPSSVREGYGRLVDKVMQG